MMETRGQFVCHKTVILWRITKFYFMTRLPSYILATFISLTGYPSNAQSFNGFELSNLLIPVHEIRKGGPPRDGIPSIDRPIFLSAGQTTFLKDNDYVLGVSWNGESKAYPIRIMDWHEVVNDYFSNDPVVVTYCPLCGSGVAFNSRVNSQSLTFGVSGLLYNSDVLLYDRQTKSLWSQLETMAISGPQSGAKLEIIPTAYITWNDWKMKYPETKVLSTETGHVRDYNRSPYQSYEGVPDLMFPVEHHNRLFRNKERVIGVAINGKHKAYPFSQLKKAKGLVIDTFQGKTLTITYDHKTKTASITDENHRNLPGITLFWFAWYAFHPDTEIYKK